MLLSMKIAFSDIAKNKKTTFIFAFQILICFIICGYIISNLMNLSSLSKKITSLGKIDSIYYLIDDTELDKDVEIMSSEDINKKLYELYLYIEEMKDFTVCRFYPTMLEIEDSRIPESLVAESFEEHFAYNILYSDTECLDFFSINISNGRLFSESDLQGTSGKIPVIAGEKYSTIFKIGDVIDEKFEIIGFIEKGNYIINIGCSGEIIELDNYLILPFCVEPEMDSMYLYQAISRSIFISNNSYPPIEIQEHALGLDLFTYNIRSFNEQLDKIKSEVKETLLQISILSGLVLLVCVVCIYTMLSVFTETHIREFVIHLMCGCTPLQIIYRLCFQILIPMFVDFLLSVIIFQNLKVTIFLLGMFVVIFLIAISPSLLKIYKNGLIGEIKRSE